MHRQGYCRVYDNLVKVQDTVCPSAASKLNDPWIQVTQQENANDFVKYVVTILNDRSLKKCIGSIILEPKLQWNFASHIST